MRTAKSASRPMWASGLALPADVARERYAALGGYTAGSTTRRSLTRYQPRSVDADAAYLPVQSTMIARGRDMVRNIPLAAGAIQRQVTYQLGEGLRLQSRPLAWALGLSADEAATWSRHTEAEYRIWAGSVECDVGREMTFADIQRLSLRSALESGDCLVLPAMFERPGSPYEFKLQVIEADRISNPGGKPDTLTLTAGVTKDNNGAPTGYWINPEHPGSRVGRRSRLGDPNRGWRRVDAFGSRTGRRLALHLYEKLRPGQTRGVPVLAPVVEMLRNLGTYTDAEVEAAVNAAFYTVFVKSDPMYGDGDLAPVAPSDEVGGATTDEDYKVASAMMIELGEGQSIETPTPGRPNSGFHPFVLAVIEQIGAALEVPAELLIQRFSSSFSASQAAMLEAWRATVARRAWFVRQFCAPVFETWLTEAVALGRIDAPGFLDGDPLVRAAWLNHAWIGPPRSHIRPDISVNASKALIDARLSTHTRESMDLTGQDWDTEVAPRLAVENQALVDTVPATTASSASARAPAEIPDTRRDDEGDEGT